MGGTNPVEMLKCFPGGFIKTAHCGFGPWLVSTIAVPMTLVPEPSLQLTIARAAASLAVISATVRELPASCAIKRGCVLAYKALTTARRVAIGTEGDDA